MEHALVGFVVLFCIIAMAVWLVDMLPLPPPARTVARVVLGIIGLVWILRWAGLWAAPGRI